LHVEDITIDLFNYAAQVENSSFLNGFIPAKSRITMVTMFTKKLLNTDNEAVRIAKAVDLKATFERAGQVNYSPIVSLTDSKALLAPRAIHDFYYRWADKGPFSSYTALWERRVTQMSEADFGGHRINEPLKRLTMPALKLHSDRAASGPKFHAKCVSTLPAKTNRPLGWRDEIKSSSIKTQ
jgi:hypothetical protein